MSLNQQNFNISAYRINEKFISFSWKLLINFKIDGEVKEGGIENRISFRANFFLSFQAIFKMAAVNGGKLFFSRESINLET